MAGRGVRGGICALLVGLSLALAGCGGSSGSPASSPQAVADRLTQTDDALRAAIDDWRAGGDPPSSMPPQTVTDQAAALQVDARYLAEHPSLTAQVLPLLPGPLAGQMTRLTRAERDLLRLSRGAGQPKLTVGAPAALSDLVSFYREAQARYGIGSNYLAAINLVETKFGRVKSDSVAGAQGPMQFIPSTWQVYGDRGDIHDPHDAILAAARLLRANGAPGSYARALRAYNDSGLYVDAVISYAREIAANPYGLYYLYSWLP
jgi:membrane-bound lytic murein transglycosylase B